MSEAIEKPYGNSAPAPYLPAKYGAYRSVNGRADAEQTNTVQTPIIVWLHLTHSKS